MVVAVAVFLVAGGGSVFPNLFVVDVVIVVVVVVVLVLVIGVVNVCFVSLCGSSTLQQHATCIKAAGLLKQMYMLPHGERCCRHNLPSFAVTVC